VQKVSKYNEIIEAYVIPVSSVNVNTKLEYYWTACSTEGAETAQRK
jgi:hypothetical protein